MPSISPTALRKQLAAGRLEPLYLLLGVDEASKAQLAHEIADQIDEPLRPFNIDRFYGDESSVGNLLDAARTLPLMADRRVVIVLRAERLLVPKRDSARAARDLEALEAFIGAPAAHATVVFVAAELDRRRRVVSQLVKRATIVECDGLEGVGDPRRWVLGRVSAAKAQIEPSALQLVVERAGGDPIRLRGDVERILLFTLGRPVIREADVLEVVGPAVAQDDWAVTRAIEAGKVDVALRELALALEAGAAPYMVLGQLGWITRTRLPASRVPRAVAAVFQTDLDLKTSAGDPRVLLERLVLELCGVGAARDEVLRRG